MYADNLQIYIQFSPSGLSNAINQLNEDIAAIWNWATVNGLQVNPTKTQLILLGGKQRITEVEMRGG